MTHPITFTKDEEHKATLALLEEVVGYMERLPPVPSTRHLCARVREHLNQPRNRLVAQTQREWTGLGPWTETERAVPLLKASLVGSSLTLKLPQPANGAHTEDDTKYMLGEIDRLLSSTEGITLGLIPGGSVVPELPTRRT